MLDIWFCLGAFLCFFLYDWNKAAKKNGVLNLGFYLGCILWAVSTVILFWNGWMIVGFHDVMQIPFGIFCFISLLLLVYSLFFALPLKKTYAEKIVESAPVCEDGFYALCRHPGFLWYFSFYLFAFLVFPCHDFFFGAVLLCLCNFVYIWAEDIVFFPQMFSNYEEYRERVPFLIPNKVSVTKCCQTLFSRKKVGM